MTNKMISTVILGASGYTGAELIRILLQHGGVAFTALTGESHAGKALGEVYPHLAHAGLPDLLTLQEVNWDGVQAVFCCLPHGTTQEVIAGLPEQLKIIDLSADFRLRDVESYAAWYGHAHRAPGLQKEAVYGLTEHAREEVKKARLVANPGCYPTASQLPLLPLLKAGLISTDDIIIDAKSGVTGAGRAAKQGMLYAELEGGMSAYGVGKHRHAPEIEQGLSDASGHSMQVRFTPHLVPMNRGILATIYVSLAKGAKAAALHEALQQAYGNESFVHVLPFGQVPSTHQVRGTNHCVIGMCEDRVQGKAILVSTIDNLVKGAAGQAVQNFNLMFGFKETRGLEATAMFP